MNTTRIFSIVLFLVAAFLAVYLARLIYNDIEHTRRVEEVEAKVINQLKIIREAQIAFQTVNGRFTADWDELKAFIDTGKLFVIQKREEIIPLDYGDDSVVLHIDTLDAVPVRDSLFSPLKYPNLDLSTLSYIPENEKGEQFVIFAEKITKSGVSVDVIEVKDINPFDRTRKEDSDLRNRRPLRFGSRTDITTAGNWE
ncbi:hypothetical protein QQ008_08510 [Fulvivirgaceae bacterium BMA10]|uniref:CHASE4 domain-containing protein n=1 Tax=Splendidivirga corallicola TaxID=3051826 RepID=A0ABT8KL03_9BACT|nr:hypothetical protein [Fulvivirgaceae bacterium BMA10]